MHTKKKGLDRGIRPFFCAGSSDAADKHVQVAGRVGASWMHFHQGGKRPHPEN